MDNWLKGESERVARLALQIKTLEASVRSAERELEESKETLARAREAQAILQSVAQNVQEAVHSRIAEVVSSCLSAVFDDPYRFKISFEKKRGRTEAKLRFERRGLEVDPVSAAGGGMVDVASFALRVASLVLCRPPLSRVVVLDEPFRFVSREYQDNVRDMLEALTEKLGLQIIMVTHNPTYATGKVVEVQG